VVTGNEDPAQLTDSEERPNQHSQAQRSQLLRHDPPEESEHPSQNLQMSSGDSGQNDQHGLSQSYPHQQESPIHDRSEMAEYSEVQAHLQHVTRDNENLLSMNESLRSLNTSLMIALNVLCSEYGAKDWVFEGCQTILKNAHDGEGPFLQDPNTI
jgi:hypothetical protein